MSSEDNETGGNVAAALALVILAGGATSIGAAVVYFPSLVNMANSKTLAISLGVSAGVMVFVSFTEIFSKSQGAFESAGFDKDKAFGLAIVTFFGGAFCMLISHYMIEALMGGHGHNEKRDKEQKKETQAAEEEVKTDQDLETDADLEAPEKEKSLSPTLESFDSLCPGDCSQNKTSDPFDGDSDDWGTMMLPCCDHEEDAQETLAGYHTMVEQLKEFEAVKLEREVCRAAGIPESQIEGHEKFAELSEEEKRREENNKMIAMSYKTAFAIALHNFPEGLATFVAALEDPKLGLVLAVAIAIHNIPEGLAVSLPMYYATGNRTKAFLCGTLSGSTEILAALLGWAVLANAVSDTVYAVVFGVVAGMMVIISVRELLPTAHRYDPEDKYVTLAFTGGMIVMALSLALIALV